MSSDPLDALISEDVDVSENTDIGHFMANGDFLTTQTEPALVGSTTSSLESVINEDRALFSFFPSSQKQDIANEHWRINLIITEHMYMGSSSMETRTDLRKHTFSTTIYGPHDHTTIESTHVGHMITLRGKRAITYTSDAALIQAIKDMETSGSVERTTSDAIRCFMRVFEDTYEITECNSVAKDNTTTMTYMLADHEYTAEMQLDVAPTTVTISVLQPMLCLIREAPVEDVSFICAKNGLRVFLRLRDIAFSLVAKLKHVTRDYELTALSQTELLIRLTHKKTPVLVAVEYKNIETFVRLVMASQRPQVFRYGRATATLVLKAITSLVQP